MIRYIFYRIALPRAGITNEISRFDRVMIQRANPKIDRCDSTEREMSLTMVAKHSKTTSRKKCEKRRVEDLLSPLLLPVVRAGRQMENGGAGHGTVTCTVKERGNTTSLFAGRESVARARTCLFVSHCLLLPPITPSCSSPRLSRPFYALSTRDINRIAVRAGHEPRVNRFREASDLEYFVVRLVWTILRESAMWKIFVRCQCNTYVI